ncbi:hypothetical protein NADE_006999 [Nannochloris sp. 'desiccata']|nr:hypothetical protein NADE_006999 [Chlorella desiccata (nom. nud.)]
MTSNETTDPTATPNTVLTHELENATLPDAKKQKQEVPEVAQPKKIFQGTAINPTYEYGKQANQQPLARSVRQDSPVASGSAAEHQPRSAIRSSFTDRGHKATILFNPLPDTPETLSDQEENSRGIHKT